MTAGLLLRARPGLALRLGANRVLTQPTLAARTVIAAALLTFTAGVVLTFLPVVAQSAGSGELRRTAAAFEPHVLQSIVTDQSTVQRLRSLEGVRAVVQLHGLTLQVGKDVTVDVVAVDCRDLNSLLRNDIAGCDGKRAVLSGLGAAVLSASEPLRVVTYEESAQGVRQARPLGVLRLAHRALESRGLETLNGLYLGAGLVPRSSVPASALTIEPEVGPDSVFVVTDGRSASLESARTALSLDGPATGREVLTIEEQIAMLEAPATRARRALVAVLALAAAAACMSLAVALADSVLERSVSLAALVAAGVKVSDLRAALVWQAVLAALPSLTVALGLSVLVGHAYATSAGTGPVHTPIVPILMSGAAAVAVVLAAVAAASVTLRTRWSPDSLRAS